jgi:Ca2+-dependent lipid-binding protein
MKIIYMAINQDRPKFLSEIIIKSLELKGPTPQLFDIKHLTPVLSDNTTQEIYADASFLVQGPVEATAETCVYIDWPKSYRIPVFVKAVVHSFSARVRIKFSSADMSDNYMQWIGKPQLRISLEPIIGNDFDLKASLPAVKRIIDNFIASLLESFEKVPLDVPL